jgi:3-hydroxyisobutyrate dehydrogenase
VVTEMLPEMGPGKTWMEMSTTDADEMVRLGTRWWRNRRRPVECPVSGGCHRADTGNISIFAGGSREAVEHVLPLLKRLGRRILHTGPLGSASKLKVMTNYLATVNLVSLCEALTVMKAAGLDLATTYEAIRISSGTSFVHETESQLILSGSRDVNFTMDLVQKDIGLFQKLAEAHDVPLEISPLLIDIMADGQRRYGAGRSPTASSSGWRRRRGCQIRADGFPIGAVDDEPEEEGYEVSRAHPEGADAR